AIHFDVLPVAAVDPDDRGLITIGVGIRAGPTEGLGPVSSEAFGMLRVEAVTERMADHLVGHHPAMPGVSQTAHAVHSPRCLENSLHAAIMTIVSYLGKTLAGFLLLSPPLSCRPPRV